MSIFVYVWFTPDNVPFYVGIGSEKRAMSPLRNKFCNHVRAKLDHVSTVLIPARNRADAESLERRLILCFGRRDLGTGPLTNLTDGGEGVPNPSPEARRRMGGNLGKRLSPETRAKMAAAKLGRTRPEWHRERMRGRRDPYRPRATGLSPEAPGGL